MPRTNRPPSYRLHKATGQAVVTLDGRDHYLGPHDTPESRAEYDRLIAEWLQHGRSLRRSAGPGPAVSEVILAYMKYADRYYVKDGAPTSEPTNIKHSLKFLRGPYGHTPAADFGPLALKSVRRAMIDAGL